MLVFFLSSSTNFCSFTRTRVVQRWPKGSGADQMTAVGSFSNLHWPLSRPVDLPIPKRTLLDYQACEQPVKKARFQLDSPVTPEDAVELEPTDQEVLQTLLRAGSQEMCVGAVELMTRCKAGHQNVKNSRAEWRSG